MSWIGIDGLVFFLFQMAAAESGGRRGRTRDGRTGGGLRGRTILRSQIQQKRDGFRGPVRGFEAKAKEVDGLQHQ